MGNDVFLPVEVDVAGAFCMPHALKDVRGQYQAGCVSLQTLQAVEDAEVRNLVCRLKAVGMRVVTDGGYRCRELLTDWDEYRRAVLSDFAFLAEVAGNDTLPKQHLLSPASVLAGMKRNGQPEGGLLEVPGAVAGNRWSDEVAAGFKSLLEALHASGCRYVQFDEFCTDVSDEAIRISNRVLRERPAGMFVAFHAPVGVLRRLNGVDAYFLNYDCNLCDRSRLLWFVRETKAVFGFVLSRYPVEDELDELQARLEEVLNYIPLARITLCLPDARSLLHHAQSDEERQWETLHLAMEMARRVYG